MRFLCLVLAACTMSASPSDPSDYALAPDLPAVCSGPEIVRIPRENGFSYGFRYKAPTRAGAPVLVYVPGGPGMTSIDQIPDLLPAGWGYLLTDPRGVGCNRLAQLPPPEFYSSPQISADVVAAIDDRQLDHYVLYGISYGTLVATQIAASVDRAPIATVMEGVLGRAFQPGEYYATAVIAQWTRLRTMMPDDVRTELDTKPSPFGIAPEGWSRVLDQVLLGGTAIVSTGFAALSSASPLHDDLLATFQMYADTPELADQQLCASDVLDSIAGGGDDLPIVLATCPLDVDITTQGI